MEGKQGLQGTGVVCGEGSREAVRGEMTRRRRMRMRMRKRRKRRMRRRRRRRRNRRWETCCMTQNEESPLREWWQL